jgi:hypothetical protein
MNTTYTAARLGLISVTYHAASLARLITVADLVVGQAAPRPLDRPPLCAALDCDFQRSTAGCLKR